MRDLSLHLLDLMENSIRVEATIIAVTIVLDPERDLLRIAVEDNGPGLSVPPETALDPFYTTKSGKRTGLGLSLMRGAAERAGGRMTLSRSPLGGLAASATMQLSHVDRSPLGDVAATLSSIACTNPEVDLWCRLVVSGREWVVRSSDVARELPAGERGGLAVARRIAEKVREGLAAAEILV
jgi:hypothetical protein